MDPDRGRRPAHTITGWWRMSLLPRPRRPPDDDGRVREQDLPHATFVRDAVVVACDGSARSDAAVRFADQEARLRGAQLVVVIAFGRPVDPDLPSFYAPDSELRSRARLAAEQAVRRALGGASPAPQIVTERGPVAWVLLRDYREAQLLVVGSSRRRMGPDPAVRGLTRHSPVPVVVVPAGPAAGAAVTRWRRPRRGLRPGR